LIRAQPQGRRATLLLTHDARRAQVTICAAGADDAGVSADINGPVLPNVDAGAGEKRLDPIFRTDA